MANNLIRVKQLDQPELSGLVQNVIESNEFTLTYGGSTGININNIGQIVASGTDIYLIDSVFNVSGTGIFNALVVNNLKVSGTSIFNDLDLNNIDNLSLSGVDITITSGNVVLTNPVSAPNLVYNIGNQTISGVKNFLSLPKVNTTGVLLSGQNVFVLQGATNQTSTAAGANYIGLAGAHMGWSASANSKIVPILENCVARKASLTFQQSTAQTPISNITGALINVTKNLTGIISQSINTTSDDNNYSFTNTNLNVPFSNGDNAVILIHNILPIGSVRTMANVYFYN